MTSEKKTKKEKRNLKMNYNKQIQSKIEDTEVQFRFNDDLMCVIEKFEKGRDEKRNDKKRQNWQIQCAVVENKIFKKMARTEKSSGWAKRSKTHWE